MLRARYHGPLGMPRLTNLGPLTSEQIGTEQFVFRGANLASLNNDEFTDNTINGREVTLYELDSEAIEEAIEAEDFDLRDAHRRGGPIPAYLRSKFGVGHDEISAAEGESGLVHGGAVPIDALRNHGFLKGVEIKPVTGGLTSGTGAAFRFAKRAAGDSPTAKVPMALYLSRNHIPADLIPIKYTAQFRDDHPHIAGWADKGAKMARFQYWVTMAQREKHYKYRSVVTGEDGSDYMNIRLDPLENFTDLDAENEIAAYLKEIGLDAALFGACCVITPLRHQQLSKRFFDEPLVEPSRDNSTVLARLRNEFESPAGYLDPIYEAVQERMEAYQDRLVVMMIKKWGKTRQKKVSRSNFIAFYDGESGTTDYDDAIPFTDPTEV